MLDINYIYTVYSEQLLYKINLCSTKINEYESTQIYIKSAIINNTAEFEKYSINVDGLIAHPFTAYSKIVYLVKNGHLGKVAQYVKSYGTVTQYLNYFKNTKTKLENCCNISIKVFKEIVFAINREISAFILEGGIFTFGLIGKIFIYEKENIQYAEWSKPIGTRIDWGATLRNKKKLEEQGVSLYNERNNPTGTKYFKYHNNDFDYWFSWISGPIYNRSLYRFYPNSFLHNVGRSIDAYVKKAKSVQQIIDTTAIGNEDKMRALLRYDPLYYLKYRRPDFDGRRFMQVSTFNSQNMVVNH